MNKKKVMKIISILILIIAILVAAYAILIDKNCEEYTEDNCPVGCIVSSSKQNAEDIGCYPSDHEKNWDR